MTEHGASDAKSAVLEVLDGVCAAWNAGDAGAFVESYLEDASAVLPGTYMKSREDIREAMAFSFGGPLKGTRSTNNLLQLRFPNDETAIAVTESAILLPGEDAAPPERTACATWILTSCEGRWMVAAYSNAPIAGQ